MKKLTHILFVALAAIAFSSCNGASDYANTNTGNENTGAKPEKTLAATLSDAEKGAYDAVQKKDGKFFNGFLADGFVGVGRNGRNIKAGVEKAISENPCETKNTSMSDVEAVELGEGIALLTSKVTSDTTCDGKANPSPVWSATIFVKDGDNWKVAYHQTVPTADAKGEFAAPPEGAGDKAADDGDKELTAKFSEMAKAGWEAWSKRDTKYFDENWGDKYLAITATAGRNDRATRLKYHGEHKCEVKSVAHEGQRTSKISENVALFTYKVNADGACDGTAIPKTIWAGSIFVKDGEAWKPAFYMGTSGADK